MSDKLKPCPFCGGEKLKIDCRSRDAIETYSVRCNKCHARGGTTSIYKGGVLANQGYAALKELQEQAKLKAIEAWNTRKPMDKVVEQLEENTSLMRSGCRHCFAMEDCDEIGDCGTALMYKAIEIVKGGWK